MKVILLQNVPKLGQKNDIKNVSEGYARNMLFPRNLAKPADSGTIKAIDTKNQIKNKQTKTQQNHIKNLLKKLSDNRVTIKGKANEKGHLFAQIHEKEIVTAINNAGMKIEGAWIKLKNPIKETGPATIIIDALGQKGEFIVEVVGE